ncbi:MAG: ATP-binding protein [Bacteroidota bacterium]
MKRLLLLWGIFACTGLMAQSEDSLRHLTKRPLQQGSAEWWSELGYLYEKKGEPDSAQYAYDQCIACAQQLGQALWQGKCLRYQSMIYLQQSRYELALARMEAAIPYLAVDTSSQDWAKGQSTLGEIYYNQGRFQLAVEHFIKSARQFERAQDSLRAGVIFGNIGAIFMEVDQVENALAYHRKNFRWIPHSDTARLIHVSYNIGSSLEALDSLGPAERWYDRALALCELYPIPRKRSYTLIGKASIAASRKQIPLAIRLIKESLAIAPDSFNYAVSLVRLGYYQGLNGKQSIAYRHLTEAQALNQRLGQQAGLLEAIDYHREIAAHFGDFAKAYRLQQQHRRLADSLGMQTLERELKALEMQYEASQKSEENLRLRAEKAESDLQLSQAQSSVRNRTILMALLLVLLLGGFIFFRKYSQDQKQLARQAAFLNQQKVQRMAQTQRLLAAEAVLEGQEKERVRLARELHDGLGGMLASAKNLLNSPSAERKEAGQAALEAVGQELRRVSHDLMPGALARFGLKVALEDLLSQSPETPQVQLQWYGPERVPEDIQSNVFRIVQELYANTLKHAQAKNVLVQIMMDQQHLHLSVEDDGKGFAATHKQLKGLGLDNVQARVAYLDGSFELQSQRAEGTTIYVQIPLKKHD